MITEDLRTLGERAASIEGRPETRLDEVRARIATTRRRRAAGATAGAVGLVLAVVIGGVVLDGATQRSEEPADPTTPTPRPTVTEEIPEGQVTLTPEIRPGDVRGWETLGTRTNRQAGLRGATDLSMTVTTHTEIDGGGSAVAWFCHGDPDTWYVMEYGAGGGTLSQCSRERPAAFPPPPDIYPWTRSHAAEEVPVRMYLTAPPPEGERDCFLRGYLPDCGGLLPLASSDAEFGFVVREHAPARHVLEVVGWPFEALATVDGVEYLVQRAVVAAPRAPRLVVRLEASDRPRVLGVYRQDPPALEACRRRHDNEGILDKPDQQHPQSAFERLDRLCVAELELRLDGRRGRAGELAGSLAAESSIRVPAGPARTVTVEVVRNDPRNVRYALVVWEARE